MPIKFKNIFKRKKPIEIVNNIKNPHLEEAYAKFPLKKLRRISKIRKKDSVGINWDLPYKLKKKYDSKYTIIHTHPSGSVIPSPNDLVNFLLYDEIKTSIIVPLTKKRRPQGYFVMTKNKDFTLSNADKENFFDSIEHYHQNILSSESYRKNASTLKELTKKYAFNYRFFPAKGMELKKDAQGFRNSRERLENKLAIISFVLISLSILLKLSNMTGNVTYGSSLNTSSTISLSLFILGLCFTFLLFLFNKIFVK